MITFALAAVSVLTLSGVAALLHAWKHAPEGHETELGFFLGQDPRNPAPAQLAPLHCEESGTGRAA